MSRTTYGKSWWGQQWLKALDGIDYSNRLPRGKSYANKGAVLNFRINKNHIEAGVQGSRPRPYKQKFELPLFDEQDKQAIIEQVSSAPHLLSALLNRQLPPELNELCERMGLPLFPHRWDDLEMQCSCPDYAVPCKHLAAVVYKIANEIDLNPFLIFELHGLDLLKALHKKGLLLEEKGQEDIAELKEMLQKAPSENYRYRLEDDTLFSIDLSAIHDQSDRLWKLFSQETLFCEKSFKPDLQKAYRQAAKQAKKLTIEESKEFDDMHRKLQTSDGLHLLLEEQALLKNIQLDTSEEAENNLALRDLQKLMQSTAPENLHLYPPAFRFLHSCWRFSMKILEEKAFIPRLIQMKGEHYSIWWVPAKLLPETKQLAEHLQSIFPEDLLIFPGNKVLKADNALDLLVNLFLKPQMLEASDKLEGHEKDELVYDCFFARHPVVFPAAASEIPNSIQLWLNRLYIHQKEFMPLIRVEEAGTQFLMSLEVEPLKEEKFEAIPLAEFMKQDKYARHRLSLLKSLNLLEEYLPQMSSLVSGERSQIAFDGERFVDILFESLPVLEFTGVSVLLPKSLRSLVRPQLSMHISKTSAETNVESALQMAELLDFDWKVSLGDEWISAKEFKELVKSSAGLVKRKGRYIHLDPKVMEQLMKQLDRPPKLSAAELIHSAFSETYKDAPVQLDEKAREMIRELKSIQSIPAPSSLQASLRPYQQRGFEWMYKNSRLGLGSLIADDMGLGKTLQVITLLLKFKEEKSLGKKQVLIVVPTSLLTNWKKEVEKFAPELSLSIYHGPKVELEGDKNLIITTYGKVRSELNKLKKLKLACLIIDEAQNIKNTSTAQTKAIKSINADIRIAMSGTPVENRLSEYWSVMDFTNKGYLGSLKKFSEEYAKPIQLEGNQQRLDAFRSITEPFIMRRLKSDKSIISDLPDKIEFNHYCALEKQQAAVYQNVVDEVMRQIEESEGMQRRGLVLNLLMALKQVCNHPYQYLKKGEHSAEMSGKAQVVLNLLDDVRAEREKCLIFTQFRESGELLSEWITERYGRKPLFLHGGTPRKQRDEMVEEFQNNPQADIFLLSLKAAGTGLNLTAASKVIHYDLWWNPAVEAQATDRAYRIGQKKEVMVYRLITEGTLEENIDAMIQKKKELADMTVASGEKWLGDLSNEELRALI
jgi:SNF2 family DNA or RNA helicase/uncharacterized Zn finger protein